MLKNQYLVAVFLCLLLGLPACNRPAQETDQDQPRAEGDSEVISAEAEWGRLLASLRVDDAGTNNGRTRIAVLEILYTLRGRLGTENTGELRRDIDVIKNTVERMYSSVNAAARGEWQMVSRDFSRLENNLDDPEVARVVLEQLIIRLGG
jgi:hypothetical protein